MGIPDTLHRLDTPDGTILAWGCPCGEEPDDNMAVVKWEVLVLGIEYSFCHVKCLGPLRESP
jgi:hypothetical protein